MLSKLIERGYKELSFQEAIAGLEFWEGQNRHGDEVEIIVNLMVGTVVVRTLDAHEDRFGPWVEEDME